MTTAETYCMYLLVSICRKNTWAYEMSVNNEMFFINENKSNKCKKNLKFMVFVCVYKNLSLINTVEQCTQAVLNFSIKCLQT